MEDVDSPEIEAWTNAENTLTHSYLDQVPARSAIRDRILHLNSFERFSVPTRYGRRYFYSHNEGLQNQNVIFWQDGLNGEAHALLLDPNAMSADGTVAMSTLSLTEDGALAAYALTDAGSDWLCFWHVREVATGRDLPDVLQWSKFSGASWLADNSGFFYSAYDAPDEAHRAEFLKSTNYFHKLYFHKLGTPQSADKLIFERPDDRELNIGGAVTNDGRYLFIYQSKGTSPNNELAVLPLTPEALATPASHILRLVPKADAHYTVIDNDGSFVWVQTTLDAPNGKVIGIDLDHPDRAHWKTILAETKNALDSVAMIDDTLIASYLADAQNRVELHARDGASLGTLPLPAIGTTDGFTGRRTDKETFFSFTNFTTPPTIYRAAFGAMGKTPATKTPAVTPYREPKLLFKPSDFETKQVFATSKDGTRVPIFLSYRKGLKLDGTNPTLLYAYGGFNISMVPARFRAQPRRYGWRWAASSPRLCCAAEASTASHGISQGPACTSRTSSTTSSHRPSTSSPTSTSSPKKLATSGRKQWRSSGGRGRDAAARPLRRRACRRRRDGHAALRQVHHRLGVEAGLRLALRERSRVPCHLSLLTASQRSLRREVSSHADHHRRPRRPRLPRAQLQVRGRHASRAGRKTHPSVGGSPF